MCVISHAQLRDLGIVTSETERRGVQPVAEDLLKLPLQEQLDFSFTTSGSMGSGAPSRVEFRF